MLAGALVWSGWYIRRLLVLTVPAAPEAPPPISSAVVSPLQVHYQLDLPGRGEIFPAMMGDVGHYWPVAVLTISNSSDRALAQDVIAEIPGWSGRFEQTLIIGPGETRKIRLSPELLPQSFALTEIRQATLRVHSSTPGMDDVGYTQTRPVYLHSGSDLYWGTKFENAQFLARWVTPHDPAVLDLVSSARRFVPRGRLPGYEQPARSRAPLDGQVRMQARAVFDALRQSGISYVTSIFTFGNFTEDAQRIRLPRETLGLRNANCIDVSVAFASAIENLGMDPVLVIVPGHAFTGARLGPDSSNILYLDLTVLPNGTFEQAEARAQHYLKTTPADAVIVVDVAATRALGIYPLPDLNSQRAALSRP